jgi:hypothetical protein
MYMSLTDRTIIFRFSDQLQEIEGKWYSFDE